MDEKNYSRVIKHAEQRLWLTWLSRFNIFAPWLQTKQVRSCGTHASHWIGGTPTEYCQRNVRKQIRCDVDILQPMKNSTNDRLVLCREFFFINFSIFYSAVAVAIAEKITNEFQFSPYLVYSFRKRAVRIIMTEKPDNFGKILSGLVFVLMAACV